MENEKIDYRSCFAFIPLTIFTAPFGLKMSMSYSAIINACGENRPERIENDDRHLIKPKKSSNVKLYLAWINDEHGLYRICGISDEISTDAYGKEIKNLFYNFKNRVEAVYGKPLITDELIDNSNLYQGERSWSYSLYEGARKLSAFEGGTNVKSSKMKDDVSCISLYAAPARQYGYFLVLIIGYEFKNSTAVENKEDSVS